MSEKDKNEQTAKGCIGCLGIIIVIALFVWISSLGGENSKKTPKKEVSNINWSAVKNAVQESKDQGFLIRIDQQNESFYINSSYWLLFDAQQKENTVRAFARYFGHFVYEMDSATGIYIKDSQSGKTIAEYSVFSGVSIK